MPRPRKFAEADVIASAQTTFTALGYAGTTIDDLVQATGLGKQSLYNSFGGKHALFLRALSAGAADAVAAVDEALAGPASTPLEKIKAQMLRLAITLSAEDRSGSLVTKAAVELAERDNEVAASSLQAFTELGAVYRRCIVDAQECGEVDASADADALASFFVALTRGMEVLGSAGVGRAELTRIAVTSLDVLPLTRPRQNHPATQSGGALP